MGAVLIAVAERVGALNQRWRRALQELSEAHQKDVLTDALTRAASRRALEFELARKLAKWSSRQTPLGLILVDVDHFKGFNDRHGHDAGDAVLRQAAAALSSTVRDTDLVARYGGEEFAIVLSASGDEAAREVAERARRVLEKSKFIHKGLQLRLTVSVGLANARENDSVATLLQRADAALYASKAAGRNCVHVHDGLTCRRAGNEGASAARTSPGEHPGKRHEDSHRDDVTGLPSRAVFVDELRRRICEVHRYGGALSLALVRVNDFVRASSDGANVVNSLLASTGRIAVSALRDADFVARFDEDVLVVLLPCTSLNDAWNPLRRLADWAAQHADPKYPLISYGVCIGAAQLSSGDEATDLVCRADSAMAVAVDGENSPQPRTGEQPNSLSLSAPLVRRAELASP